MLGMFYSGIPTLAVPNSAWNAPYFRVATRNAAAAIRLAVVFFVLQQQPRIAVRRPSSSSPPPVSFVVFADECTCKAKEGRGRGSHLQCSEKIKQGAWCYIRRSCCCYYCCFYVF